MQAVTVAFSGTRDIPEASVPGLIQQGVEQLGLWAGMKPGKVLHGDSGTVDLGADAWAAQEGLLRVKFPADWKNLGKKAGPFRTVRMVEDHAQAVIAVWDGQSRGTQWAIQAARRKGIPCMVVYAGPARPCTIVDVFKEDKKEPMKVMWETYCGPVLGPRTGWTEGFLAQGLDQTLDRVESMLRYGEWLLKWSTFGSEVWVKNLDKPFSRLLGGLRSHRLACYCNHPVCHVELIAALVNKDEERLDLLLTREGWDALANGSMKPAREG